MNTYILAHDLGTSGNKATLYHTDGRLMASCVVSYDTSYPHPGWAEQNPWDWWAAVCRSTKDLLLKAGVKPEEIACVSFSAQMMGCLLTDEKGLPLRPMIIWADTRASQEEAWMKERIGMERGYQITGHRISASYSAAKLLWVRTHEPEVYKRSRWMLHAKDFIIYHLTGQFVTDYSDASGTNLFDIRQKCWSEEILQALDIEKDLLPTPRPSTDQAGIITGKAAEATGLMEGTPVIIGGGDGSCACVGAGVVEEGSAYHVLGSSSWISMAGKSPYFDPEMRTFNWVHLDPALYTPCGTMQAAGYSYHWFKNTVCSGDNYESVNKGALLAEPGANGLLYLPYLLGERSPRWNHDARGVFAGLSITTTKKDMSRAVLEGVGFNLKVILDSLKAAGDIRELMIIGGGAKGEAWVKILADVFQMPLKVPAYLEEATSLGAAVCGGVGIGIYPDFSVVKKINRIDRIVKPDRNLAGRYEELYRIFNHTYEALTEVYGELGDYRRKYEEVT